MNKFKGTPVLITHLEKINTFRCNKAYVASHLRIYFSWEYYISDWILSKILNTFGTFTEKSRVHKYTVEYKVHLLVLQQCT